MITVNGIEIVSDNPKWFTVLDGYLMSIELVERYNRLVPMRVLRAIDVIDESKIEYALANNFYSYVFDRLNTLDYWSSLWLELYLGYNTNTPIKERAILFERLMKQYDKVKNDL